MELLDFYEKVALSFSLSYDDEGLLYVSDEELIIDDKPAVLPSKEHIEYLVKTREADRYLFNPLAGNVNSVRDDYLKLLDILHISIFSAVKDIMIKISKKIVENNMDGIGTPTIINRLMRAKGQAKTLVDDENINIITNLSIDDGLTALAVISNGEHMGEKVNAMLSINSPLLEQLEDGDNIYKRKKDNRYIRALLEVILEDIIKESKLIISNNETSSECLVVLKANIFIYNKLKELTDDLDIKLLWNVPRYELKDGILNDLIEEAVKLPLVVGNEVIVSSTKKKRKLKTIDEVEPKRVKRRVYDDYEEDEEDFESDNSIAIKRKIAKLEEKQVLTVDEMKELNHLRRLLEDDIRRNSRRGRRESSREPRRSSSRRGYSKYDDYDDDDYYRGKSYRGRRVSIDDLYYRR